jgi:hypothetical protein
VEKGVYVKSTNHGRETLVACCDAELLGEILEGGRAPFKVSEGFYRGILMEAEEALEFIKRGTIVNLVGQRIVEAAIGAKLVHPEAILYLGKIPHAQIVQL